MSNSPATILVVDDNPGTLYSTSRVLRGAGWTVIEATTGTEAIEQALTGVDMLVLDINLPDFDGYTVCRRLRNNESTARLPIIHLSASFVSSDHKVTGLEAGADGFLTHPIEPPVLIATVNAFLRTRQAEIELRMSEARFKAVFENALTGVTLLDESLRFVDVNPTMCRMLDLERASILGRPFQDFVPAEEEARLQALVSTVKQELAWHGTLSLKSASDRLIHLEWHISQHAEPGLLLAIASDISDRVQYEAERDSLLISERAARHDAERANSLKDDFLATLSHELRTPLNAIVGWSQVLQLGKLPAAEAKEGLDAIERNARAQAKMIADLLDISRITSGKLRLDVEKLDPAAVIEAAISAIMPTADAKSIHVTRSLDGQCGPISGDVSRLQQVIWNLVNNAVKFTPQNGRVHITLQKIDSQVVIRVTDNGEGIDDDLLPRIFDRFRQGDASSTRAHGGLGLGLAIAKQLVELHAGTISAESPGPGQGATFVVTLPLLAHKQETDFPQKTWSQPEPEPRPRGATIDLAGTRILLVEDDADSRRVITRIITDSGGEVCDVCSVAEALQKLDGFQPAILVSDLGMPERDGFELIHEVRQRGYKSQTLPAIALTAFARPEDRHRALIAGFQFHLAKPVDPYELNAVIASLVGKTG